MRAPPSSTFTQATAIGPVSSPTSSDPKDGSTASCRLKSPTSRTIPSAACGRSRSEPGRDNVEVVSADLVAMPEVTQPVDVLWLHLFYHDLHTALMQAKGATAAQLQSSCLRTAEVRWALMSSSTTPPPSGRARTTRSHYIGLSMRPSRAEVEAAGFVHGRREHPCSRTRTMRIRSRCSIPRSRARPIASPIGS